MFKKRPPIVNSPTKFPTGTVVRTKDGVFFVKDSLLLRITTQKILNSWRFPRIVEATPDAVRDFMIGGKLGFRDGTVLRSYADNKTYLVSGQKVRHITDPDVFPCLGITYEDLVLVSEDEVRIHEEGEPLGAICTSFLAAE